MLFFVRNILNTAFLLVSLMYCLLMIVGCASSQNYDQGIHLIDNVRISISDNITFDHILRRALKYHGLKPKRGELSGFSYNIHIASINVDQNAEPSLGGSLYRASRITLHIDVVFEDYRGLSIGERTFEAERIFAYEISNIASISYQEEKYIEAMYRELSLSIVEHLILLHNDQLKAGREVV